MNKIRKLIERLWDKLLVVCGVFFVLGPTSPWNMPLTYRDSGVFLYAGWRILNGEIPYRDFWDHKPPVIFYLNALGLLISNNSRWGVWLIEFLAVCLAAYIGFRLIRKLLGAYPAVFSLFLWLLTLAFVIEGGNLTTEYALLLQFAALWRSTTLTNLAFQIGAGSWWESLVDLLSSRNRRLLGFGSPLCST